jgi:hypothetical protein
MLNWLGPHGSRQRAARYQVLFAVGVGVVALVASAGTFILYFQFKANIAAYRSTPRCASPGDAVTSACRYSGPARILSTSRTDQLRASVQFSALRSQTFTARFPNNGEPGSGALAAGTITDGELLSGKVTRLAGKPTSDSPESTSPDSILPIAWALLVGALVVFALSVGLARVNWRIQN